MLNNFSPAPPDFDKLVWACPCCDQKRTDKFFKVMTYDIGSLYNQEPGIIFVNCKYCVDMPECKEKAIDREWVIKRFLPGLIKNE